MESAELKNADVAPNPDTDPVDDNAAENGELSNGTQATVLNSKRKMGRPISRRRSEQGVDVVKPLTGRALLQKLKECAHLPIREQARRCGYLSRAKSPDGGHEKANLVDFYQAQVEARGHILEPKTQRDRRGREPANRVTVHKNGQIVIGVAYTQMMGLAPGDEFEIKLGYKHIRLNQLDGGEDLG